MNLLSFAILAFLTVFVTHLSASDFSENGELLLEEIEKRETPKVTEPMDSDADSPAVDSRPAFGYNNPFFGFNDPFRKGAHTES